MPMSGWLADSLVDNRQMGYAAAIVRSTVRPMTAAESTTWRDWQDAWSIKREAAGRPPHLLALAGDKCADAEHAAGTEGTLCGIAEVEIDRYRHLFDADQPYACPTCVAIAATRS
jgi:hypothetical protein